MAKAKLLIEKYIALKHATMIERMALAKLSRGAIKKSLLCMEMTNLLDNFYLFPNVVLRAWVRTKPSGEECIMVAVGIDDDGEEVWNSAEGWL